MLILMPSHMRHPSQAQREGLQLEEGGVEAVSLVCTRRSPEEVWHPAVVPGREDGVWELRRGSSAAPPCEQL